jgi:hypothetical protein
MTTVFIKDDDDDVFDSNGVLKDGATHTTKMFARDGSALPGFTPVQIAIAATKAATKTFDRAMHLPNQPGYIRRDTGTGITDAAAVAARDAADKVLDVAYAEYSRMQDDAYKTKSLPPAGSYPEGSSSEGDPCTVNGSPGTLQSIEGHSGWLRCVADDDANNNAGTDDSRQQLDATAVQKIKDDAYDAYSLDIENAWRKPVI